MGTPPFKPGAERQSEIDLPDLVSQYDALFISFLYLKTILLKRLIYTHDYGE